VCKCSRKDGIFAAVVVAAVVHVVAVVFETLLRFI